METRYFGPSGVVHLRALNPLEPIQESDLILIKLDDLVIDRLLSQDLTRKREGTLVIRVNDQVTSLSWAAKEGKKVYNVHKFQNQLLFWGVAGKFLKLEVQFIEVDRNLRPKLFKFLSESAKLIPSLGGIVSAGVSLLHGIINSIQKEDDDSELEFFGTMGNAGSPEGLISGWFVDFTTGIFDVRRKIPNEVNPQVRIPFSVFKLSPPKKIAKREVLVLLEQVVIRSNQDKNYRTLVIESAIGSGRKVEKNTFNIKMQNRNKSPEHFLGFQYTMLYNDLWDTGLPFHFSMAFLEKEELDAIEEIVDYSGDLAIELLGETVEQRALINQTTKATQSLRSLVMEFLPDKISIGSIHGLMLDAQMVTGTTLAQEMPGEMLKIINLNENEWTVVDINLHSEQGGEASIRLKIKELAENKTVA